MIGAEETPGGSTSGRGINMGPKGPYRLVPLFLSNYYFAASKFIVLGYWSQYACSHVNKLMEHDYMCTGLYPYDFLRD